MAEENYERILGVAEAFTVVTRQCPSAPVRKCAEQALEAAKQGNTQVLREQAYFVLTSMRGWRGDRAAQVLRSLQAFLDQTAQNDASSG